MLYADCLRQLLEPLAVYQLTDSINGAELETVGQQLDIFAMFQLDIEDESHITTATSYGIENYETIMSIPMPRLQVDGRQRVVKANLMMQDGMFSGAAIADMFLNCGFIAGLVEGETPFSISVLLPQQAGVQQVNRQAMKKYILAMLPCHLDVTFVENGL